MAKFLNVEARKKSIRIRFKYSGEWCKETLSMEPTRENQKLASIRLVEINKAISLKTFNYRDEFPNSKKPDELGLPKVEEKHSPLFGEVAHDYIATIQRLDPETIKSYKKILNSIWLPEIGGRKIDELKYSELAKLVDSINWGSPKTRNNSLVPLRGVFKVAQKDGVLISNPCDLIENQSHQKKPPDPLSLAEVDSILNRIKEKYHAQIHNYFEFAFFTGLRIEELIAIEWGDVDFNKNQIRIQRARTLGEVKDTKTFKVRDVDLNQRSLSALHRQKDHSFLNDGVIFLNPYTGKQWNGNGKPQRIRYWNPTLKYLGIRHRPPKNTRHTFATMLLMSGSMPSYAASQMGHSIVVFLTVYSKWIDSDEQQGQRQKLDSFISTGQF